ncbi:hypothetical protein PR048_021632 [Dryococelus australis]|uniref:Uncharacterized protein n=1 Tax=Dryococelus australis TaxID=614101 RepID=A0ABQ9GYQ8_9NEOP|nr:hypothetical protein PR048_021632 [Dryococelus australis]
MTGHSENDCDYVDGKNIIGKTLLEFQDIEDEKPPSVKDESEMKTQSKFKYFRSEKITILSVLPCRIQNKLRVSDNIVRSVKQLVKEKGVLSRPNPKPGKTNIQHQFSLFLISITKTM